MIIRKRRNTQRRKVTFEIKDFKGGSNKLLDEARIAPNESTIATNLIQVQDGLWRIRWGSDYYGETLGDTFDGGAEKVKKKHHT